METQCWSPRPRRRVGQSGSGHLRSRAAATTAADQEKTASSHGWSVLPTKKRERKIDDTRSAAQIERNVGFCGARFQRTQQINWCAGYAGVRCKQTFVWLTNFRKGMKSKLSEPGGTKARTEMGWVVGCSWQSGCSIAFLVVLWSAMEAETLGLASCLISQFCPQIFDETSL